MSGLWHELEGLNVGGGEAGVVDLVKPRNGGLGHLGTRVLGHGEVAALVDVLAHRREPHWNSEGICQWNSEDNVAVLHLILY